MGAQIKSIVAKSMGPTVNDEVVDDQSNDVIDCRKKLPGGKNMSDGSNMDYRHQLTQLLLFQLSWFRFFVCINDFV